MARAEIDEASGNTPYGTVILPFAQGSRNKGTLQGVRTLEFPFFT
jgi:hypothetical protein